jgi:pimeloyl-ACP methyl ester carboxylesterase
MRSSSSPVAPVVQLLGDIDDVVTRCDQQDVAVAKDDFFFVPVRWTNHSGIIEVGPKAPSGLSDYVAAERQARLREALTWPIEKLRQQYAHGVEGEDPDVDHVVFVMHGIRDYGGWTARMASAITNQDYRRGSVVVVPSSYGYFPMGSFLLLGERQKNVRWFMDQYTQAVAQYPYAKVSYIGHSNGTYLLASALERYRTLRVHRVFFAGSVVRSGYRWDQFYRGRKPRVGEVRNVVASRDMVVGIFPRFFELVTEHAPVSSRGFFDLGAAGFRGFAERQVNLEYAQGGHAAALDDEAELQAIAEYILGESESSNGQEPLSVFLQAEDPVWFANWTSRLCWLVWLSLIAIVVFFGRLFHLWVRKSWPRLGRVGWGIYVLLLLAILQTV